VAKHERKRPHFRGGELSVKMGEKNKGKGETSGETLLT